MSKPIINRNESDECCEQTVATSMSASWDLGNESFEGRDDDDNGTTGANRGGGIMKKRPRVYDSSSLQVGKLLGKGSFCVVSETPELPHSAIKMVNPELQERSHESRKRKETYHVALEDLAYEAGLLSNLHHPNIISLQGVSNMGASDFIVIEKLSMTLAQRLKNWSRLEKISKRSTIVGYDSSSSSMIMSSSQAKNRLAESLDDRITIALDLASVLEYLHNQGIVYRDLKPENIGFDSAGDLKLFDFGMAKRLSEAKRAHDGINYHLTSMTGTLRYMSPEVGTGVPYNTSTDIYSWSMILYQLLSLQVPFGSKCTPQFIMCGVFQFGVRPSLTNHQGIWSDRLINLLKTSWSSTSSKRPTPSEICDTLECELNERAMYSSSSSSSSSSYDEERMSIQDAFTRYFDSSSSNNEEGEELRSSPSSSSSSSSSSNNSVIEETSSFGSSSSSSLMMMEQPVQLLQSPGHIEIVISSNPPTTKINTTTPHLLSSSDRITPAAIAA